MDAFNFVKGIEDDIATAIDETMPRQAVVTRSDRHTAWVQFSPVDSSKTEMQFPTTDAYLAPGTSGWVQSLAGGKGMFVPAARTAESRTFDTRAYASIQDTIDAAHAAGGGDVFLPPGTYNEKFTPKNGVYIRGAGSGATTIDISGLSPTNGAHIFGGGEATALPSLSVGIPQHSSIIIFSSAIPVDVVPGSWLRIWNPAAFSFSPHRASYRDGEDVIVETVAPDRLSVTTTTRRFAAHPSSANVYLVDPINTGISGVSVVGTTAFQSVKIRWGRNLVFDDLVMTGSNSANLSVDKSYGVWLSNIRAFDTSVSVARNYGIIISNCQTVFGDKLYLETRRHGMTLGGDGEPGSIPCRDIRISNSYINGMDTLPGVTGFSPHGNCEFVTMDNVTFPNGVTVGGDEVKLHNCHVWQSAAGQLLVGTGLIGANITVEDCDFHMTRHYTDAYGAPMYMQWTMEQDSDPSQSEVARSNGCVRFKNNTVEMGPYRRNDDVQTVVLRIRNIDTLKQDNDIDIDDFRVYSTHNQNTQALAAAIVVQCDSGRSFRHVRVAGLRGNLGVLINGVAPRELVLEDIHLYEAKLQGLVVIQPASPVWVGSVYRISNVNIYGSQGTALDIAGRQSDSTLILNDITIFDANKNNTGTSAQRSAMNIDGFASVLRNGCYIGEKSGAGNMHRADTFSNITKLVDNDTEIIGSVTTQTRIGVTTELYRGRGAGAPTRNVSNGSTYIRTDGSGTNDNMYIRRGGAWVGIA